MTQYLQLVASEDDSEFNKTAIESASTDCGDKDQRDLNEDMSNTVTDPNPSISEIKKPTPASIAKEGQQNTSHEASGTATSPESKISHTSEPSRNLMRFQTEILATTMTLARDYDAAYINGWRVKFRNWASKHTGDLTSCNEWDTFSPKEINDLENFLFYDLTGNGTVNHLNKIIRNYNKYHSGLEQRIGYTADRLARRSAVPEITRKLFKSFVPSPSNQSDNDTFRDPIQTEIIMDRCYLDVEEGFCAVAKSNGVAAALRHFLQFPLPRMGLARIPCRTR